MLADTDAAYHALLARDARFDGRLFVGVTSTGIYCRPVCRVRTPRREHCRFFATRAQAEAAAFRPCLKCRPEIAPGLSLMDSSRSLADAAARALSQSVLDGQGLTLAALAARLGVTDRHLRRIFTATHGVSPQRWLTTQRLLLAKQLLTDTSLPVTQVALAAGFDSLRRFHAAFAQQYRLTPTRLRHDGRAPAATPGGAATALLKLAYRPPYDLGAMLGFFARRQLAGVEQIEGLALRRTLAWPAPGAPAAPLDGWIDARFVPERHELHLAVAPSLAPVLGAVLQRVRQVFDLDAEPERIDAAMASLPGPLRPGLRLPGSFDGFETAVRTVLGQQITVAAARTLAERLVQRFGRPVATPWPGLDRVFPSAATLAAADPAAIGTLGIVRQRVGALQALARAVAEGRLRLQPGADLDGTLQALLALPGIGPWSAQLIAARCLAWPDAWPASDIALLKALAPAGQPRCTPAAGEAAAEAWRPWRSYAVLQLWTRQEDPA